MQRTQRAAAATRASRTSGAGAASLAATTARSPAGVRFDALCVVLSLPVVAVQGAHASSAPAAFGVQFETLPGFFDASAACPVECASCTDAIYTCCWPHEPHDLPALSACCSTQTFACADPDGLSCRQVLRPRSLEDGRCLQPPLRLRVIPRLPGCAAEPPYLLLCHL